MTDATIASEPTPARRRFLRQGQLAGAASGGIVASVIGGLLPPRATLVRVGPELASAPLDGILVALAFMVMGMAAGYLVWVLAYERRRPTFLGRPWTGERDWAITGGIFVAYVLTRIVIPTDPGRAGGLFSTDDPEVFLRVEAPVDLAVAFVRFLASASISAILLRLIADGLNGLRARS